MLSVFFGFCFHSQSYYFFHFVSDPLLYTARREALPLRMKRLLELIFIFCAMPMAFSECVMCYHQDLIMQLKCKKFKSSALLALSAVCTLLKALLEQIRDQFWSKITTCFRKKGI